MSFDRNMAIWLKGKEFISQTSADGEVVVMPNSNRDIYSTIDPEKKEAWYWQDFPGEVRSATIPVTDLDDLRYFVELLLEND